MRGKDHDYSVRGRSGRGAQNDEWSCSTEEAFPGSWSRKMTTAHWFIISGFANNWVINGLPSWYTSPGGILNASFFFLAESIFLLGWIVRRRRKTSEVLDIWRPVVQQLEWEKDEELSARRSHCVIGAGLRDGGVPSPEYFSPTTSSTTMTIAME